MTDCGRSKFLLTDELYREITPSDRIWLQDHLTRCAKCAARYQKFKDAAEFMSLRKRPEPSPEYWNTFSEKLAKKLVNVQPIPAKKKYFWQQTKMPLRFLRIASVALLVLGGVLIGRYYVPSTVQVTDLSHKNVQPVGTPVSLDQRAQHFLDRSEVLILGLVHVDEAQSPINLSTSKEVSKELIQEASYLKNELSESDKRKKLERLVGDLEFILMQIANLESENELPEIELVRKGVDERSILLKIRLEQGKLIEPLEKSTSSAGKSKL